MGIFNRGETAEIRQALDGSVSSIRDELDEHRETINQNTNEIQANYEFLCRIDKKIEKLSERIDELSMFFQDRTKGRDDYQVSRLTSREKEVFLSLYTSENGQTYKDISRRTGLSENLVVCYISNLVAKGIPVLKRFTGNLVLLSLEPSFRELQMKENIVGINETIGNQVMV